MNARSHRDDGQTGAVKLVVGTDGSDDAQRGVSWAATYAQALDAEVVAVYSIELVYPAAPVAVPVLPEVDESRRREVEAALDEMCAPLRDAGVPYRTVVADGNAAAALEDIATDEGADLIVIGRRGRGGFQELVLGSVSHQLLHHTRHTVAVVPPEEAAGS